MSKGQVSNITLLASIHLDGAIYMEQWIIGES